MNNDLLQNSAFSEELKAGTRSLGKVAVVAAIVALVSATLTFLQEIIRGEIISSLVSAGISVALNIFLFRFGRSAQAAVDREDQEEAISGFYSLNMYFKIFGILLIVVCVIVLLVLLFGIGTIMEIMRR
jgi:hypothetical protein